MSARSGLTVCVALAAALVLSPLMLLWPARASSQPAQPAPASQRKPLANLTRPERDAVRAEMRQMLASVHGIVRAVSSGDLAAAEKAARASGMATAADPHLEHKLPRPFLEMGESVHRGFDAIADAAKAGAGKDALFDKLGEVTGTCVACHAVYRLATSQ